MIDGEVGKLLMHIIVDRTQSRKIMKTRHIVASRVSFLEIS